MSVEQPVLCPHCGTRTQVARRLIERIKTNINNGPLVLCGMCSGPIVMAIDKKPVLVTSELKKSNPQLFRFGRG